MLFYNNIHIPKWSSNNIVKLNVFNVTRLPHVTIDNTSLFSPISQYRSRVNKIFNLQYCDELLLSILILKSSFVFLPIFISSTLWYCLAEVFIYSHLMTCYNLFPGFSACVVTLLSVHLSLYTLCPFHPESSSALLPFVLKSQITNLMLS